MSETISKDSIMKVYEIGYLLVSSIPAEKITEITASLRDILSKKGAIMLAEESPILRELSYIMVKKIGTQNKNFDQGYFGWFKFELASLEIEEVKKAFELNPDMLRMLLITTIKENTYLGKKALVEVEKSTSVDDLEQKVPVPTASSTISASIEEMDKSIDEMVKGA